MLYHAIAAAILLTLPVSAQDTSAEALEKVDALFETWNEFDKPGMAVGIVSRGELVYAKGFGMANLETGMPNGPDILYRIGSNSKQFTATAITLLELDEQLDLDAPLTKYFPEFTKQDPPVLVRHLLHHTSGIPDYVGIQFRSGGGTQGLVYSRAIFRNALDGKARVHPGQSLRLQQLQLHLDGGAREAHQRAKPPRFRKRTDI